MLNEEKTVEGNEGDGEGGEEDARGLGRRHQLANHLLQHLHQDDREVGGDGGPFRPSKPFINIHISFILSRRKVENFAFSLFYFF